MYTGSMDAAIAEMVTLAEGKREIPSLYIYDHNEVLAGHIYIVDHDSKIMSGEDNPDIVHICHLMRQAITAACTKRA